ncbi:MAG: PHP domain-containing protein, partial [Spirochaetaceae bacterium]|nr:PHP domain-containing protein [Spirochaetaceae bacterium]
MIDLHSHSTASDGSLSPAALVGLARERGLIALALTDHDTIAGLGEAEAAARDAGLRLVRGVEIEIAFEPGEFHLLGLDLSPGGSGE